MTESTFFIITIALLVLSIILIIVFRNKEDKALPSLQNKLSELQASLEKLEHNFKEDFRINREENSGIAGNNRAELNATLLGIKAELSNLLHSATLQNQNALKEINTTLADKNEALTLQILNHNRNNREELAANMNAFAREQKGKFDELKAEQKELTALTSEQLSKISDKVEEKLARLNEQNKVDSSLMRGELTTSFKSFNEAFEKSIQAFSQLQKEKFSEVEAKQNELIKNTESKLDLIRSTVEEKLEKTLSDRLGQSFETVGKQLIEVQKGLGEMQSMAADVGGLKKVLSNVKLRGGIGEVQLAMLLEQILAPSQYEANVATVDGSPERVEFAVKLPGRNNDDTSFIYLPIDAKFPKESYEQLIAAYENAVPDDIEAATKNLENTIRKMAKDISEKYLGPNTTDFAIMFLPFESIYAEVIRRSALVDQLRFEYKITVAGPTTLMALLNSLQMGFRAMALQKRSGEVWKVLARVKSEFEKFGGILEKAQKNIQTGLGQLELASGTRTRAIKRQLNDIEAIPTPELPVGTPGTGQEELTIEDEFWEENNDRARQPEIPFD